MYPCYLVQDVPVCARQVLSFQVAHPEQPRDVENFITCCTNEENAAEACCAQIACASLRYTDEVAKHRLDEPQRSSPTSAFQFTTASWQSISRSLIKHLKPRPGASKETAAMMPVAVDLSIPNNTMNAGKLKRFVW